MVLNMVMSTMLMLGLICCISTTTILRLEDGSRARVLCGTMVHLLHDIFETLTLQGLVLVMGG